MGSEIIEHLIAPARVRNAYQALTQCLAIHILPVMTCFADGTDQVIAILSRDGVMIIMLLRSPFQRVELRGMRLTVYRYKGLLDLFGRVTGEERGTTAPLLVTIVERLPAR